MRSTPRHPLARLETWCYTGPLGHLLGGVLDVGTMFIGWQLLQARRRVARAWARRRGGPRH